jgi:hypothetical protein
MTAQDMRGMLYRHYSGRCAVLFEIGSDARVEGPGVSGFPRHRARRIDALTVSAARKKGIGPLDLMAIEIKVDRRDFLSDVRDPAKQAGWREIAHRHAYAVPEGLAKPEEIPEGSGLLVARTSESGRRRWLEWERRAPYTQTPELRSWLTLTLAWRMSVAEAKIRGLSTSSPEGDTVEDLRGQLLHAQGEIGTLSSRLERAREEAGRWRTAYAVNGHLPCAHCAKPVKPKIRRGGFGDWQHVTAADEGPCSEIRAGKGRWVEVRPADDDAEEAS